MTRFDFDQLMAKLAQDQRSIVISTNHVVRKKLQENIDAAREKLWNAIVNKEYEYHG